MGTIIIALIAIAIMLIQKAESTLSNKKLLAKVDLFHARMESQMMGIVTMPYVETRKKSTKWILFLFILVAILHYVSAAIFGDNSMHGFLRDKKVLLFVVVIMIIIVGHYNRKDLFKVGTAVAFAGGFMIYAIHNQVNTMGGTGILLAELPIELAWKDTFVILGGIAFFGAIILFVLLARLISFILYLLIKGAFYVCLYVAPVKPLKGLIVMVECISVLGVAIMSVI